ncbi:hypothetical protein JCM11251_004478 [Rhodosporidiobolus azoricus]
MRLEQLPRVAEYWAKAPSRRLLVRNADLTIAGMKLPADAVAPKLPSSAEGVQRHVMVEDAVPDSVRRTRQHYLFVRDEQGMPSQVDPQYLFEHAAPMLATAFNHFLDKHQIDTTQTLFRRIDNFGLYFDLAPLFHYLNWLYRLKPDQRSAAAYHRTFALLVLDQGLLPPRQRDRLPGKDVDELAMWLAYQFPEAGALFRYVSEQLYNHPRDLLTDNGKNPERWEEYLEWTGVASLQESHKHFMQEHVLLGMDETREPRITLADYLLIAPAAFDSFRQHRYPRAAPQPPVRNHHRVSAQSSASLSRSSSDGSSSLPNMVVGPANFEYEKAATFPQM